MYVFEQGDEEQQYIYRKRERGGREGGYNSLFNVKRHDLMTNEHW